MRPTRPLASDSFVMPCTRRSRRAILLSLAALTAGGLSGLVREAMALGANPVKPGMQRINGRVTVNGRPAVVGMLIGAGDSVETGPGAEAIYVIGEDAYLQRAESRVTFAAGVPAAALRVLTGKLLSVFGSGPRELVIPGATIGIRGTGCYVESDARRSYFCLCYGRAVVSTERDRPLEYETQHHERPLWIQDGTAFGAEVINHTDAELVMLEQLVGRWPPFYGVRDSTY